MLARLGRWLRAAGYDTLIAGDVPDDRVLLDTALAEGRVLLTRDRALAGHGQAKARVVRLESDRVPDQARELRQRIGVDWLYDPFTRCIVDNTPLRPAEGHETDAIPLKARALGGPFRACPACGRLYWQGSHHRRMARRLETWQRPGA